ncbi:VRR-NUC domain-containing protein [Kickxella alabastrina]|uniref:VRR-NUC domain-containing protein n=1 Tax=Kickxella alabastrina TaxID=61397 RepID=UPI00222116BD|nr:VRR-NUC domain-containing protein [Kickxella alabastrina]KAI7827339.1 VRR-NUC domain-containing protein [Kickxella alabastrina]
MTMIASSSRSESAVVVLDSSDDSEFSDGSIVEVMDLQYSASYPQRKRSNEAVVLPISAVLDLGNPAASRSESVSLDEQQTPERLSYLHIFDRILETVLRGESHLFSEDEKKTLASFSSLDQHSRYLYTRLYMRKQSWIRVSSLKYGDKMIVEQSCKLLCRRSSNNTEPLLLAETEIEDCNDALHLLTSPELKVFAKKKGVKQIANKTKDFICEMITKSAKQRTRLNGLIQEVSKITGPMVHLNPAIVDLFARLHMVFFRSLAPMGVDNAIKLAILAVIGQIKFPQYTVARSVDLFVSRNDVILFKTLMEVGFKMAELGQFSVKDVDRHTEGWSLYLDHSEMWAKHIELLRKNACKNITPLPSRVGVEYWRRHFIPGYALARIVEGGAKFAANLKRFDEEERILQSLLSQTAYLLNRRGDWYGRLILLYTKHLRPRQVKGDKEIERHIGQLMQRARDTCIRALRDDHVHRVSLRALTRQLRSIEAKLDVSIENQYEHPRAQLEWREAPERIFFGVRILCPNRHGPSMWDGNDDIPCSVEQLALWRYRDQGYVGLHSENAIVRTLFCLLFWDIILHAMPGVLDTEYQSQPLDMNSESFYYSRQGLIDQRLQDISGGDFESHIRRSYAIGYGTTCAGVSWDFTLEHVMAKEYRIKSSGFPDLCMWNPVTKKIMFAEVKGPKDKLSETQRDWIDILLSNDIAVEVCLVREGDSRDHEQE